MKIYKALLSLFLLLMFTTSLFSQNKEVIKDDEKIKAEKIAFITERIDLTVKEAQDFWPIYNECNEKMNKLFEEELKICQDLKNSSSLADKDILNKTDRLIDIKSERASIEKEYHQKYKLALPIKKIALLYQADREFRKHLLKKYNKKCEE